MKKGWVECVKGDTIFELTYRLNLRPESIMNVFSHTTREYGKKLKKRRPYSTIELGRNGQPT